MFKAIPMFKAILKNKTQINRALNEIVKSTSQQLILTTQEDSIQIETVNSDEISLTVLVDAEVDEAEQRCCINAGKLQHFIKKLPTKRKITLSVCTADGVFQIECEEKTHKIDLLDEIDCKLPHKPFQQEEWFGVDAEFLSGALEKVLPHRSTDETRPYLHGIFLERKEGKILLTTTDGHRLAQLEKQCEGTENHYGILLTAQLAKTVISLTKKMKSQVVSYSIQDKKIFFQSDGWMCSQSLLMGRFPDYRQIIPKMGKSKVRIVVESELLQIALDNAKMCSPIAGQTHWIVRDEKLQIVAQTTVKTGVARAEHNILCAMPQETDFEIGLSAYYVLDILKNVGSKKVEIGFENHLSPCLVEPEHNAEERYVVMPMRL